MKKAVPEIKSNLFEPEPVFCSTCGEKQATHEVHIRVQRGSGYHDNKQLYSVMYAVCGDCAKDIVVIQLGAKLGGRK